MAPISNYIVFFMTAMASVNAFTTTFFGSSSVASRPAFSSSSLTMRVVDIDSEAAFDKTIASAGSSLVVVDYSTTWCGPCKGEKLVTLLLLFARRNTTILRYLVPPVSLLTILKSILSQYTRISQSILPYFLINYFSHLT